MNFSSDFHILCLLFVSFLSNECCFLSFKRTSIVYHSSISMSILCMILFDFFSSIKPPSAHGTIFGFCEVLLSLRRRKHSVIKYTTTLMAFYRSNSVSFICIHHCCIIVFLNLPRLKSQGSWELLSIEKIFTKLSP